MAKTKEETSNDKTQSSWLGLHRSLNNRIIAGVAGGLGEYFNIDPTFIRIIFVLLTFFGGSGVLIYLVLWLIMPSETSSSHNPHDHLHENINDLKESAHRFAQDIRFSRGNPDSRRWGGIIILVIGILFLLDSFGIYTGWYISRLWPLILIIIGLLILAR